VSEQRTTDILERMLFGSEFVLCNYDDDIDIAVPKRYSITTGAKKATRGTGAGVWIGGESDPEEDQDNTA
jgi:hypothetical protein